MERISLKLAQLESAFEFLDELNNNPSRTTDAPRNLTERSTVARSLWRAREVREMFRTIHGRSSRSMSNEDLAAQQFLHDS